MTPPPEHVSVALPVGQAIDRVKRVLFQPFDLGKWVTIGFCAWLAHLGERGSSPNFHFGNHHGGGMDSLRVELEKAWTYLLHNLGWILPLAAAVLLLIIAFWGLILWLSSRGRFMFLHCVALDTAEVAVPWRKFTRQANSLFWFRLGVGLVSLLATLPLLAVILLTAWRMIQRGRAGVGGVLELVGLGMLLFLVAAMFWIIAKLTTDFVVPIMFRRGGRCLQAWGVLLGLLAGNFGRFILYFLFQFVLWLAIVVLVVTVVLLTCCILGCVVLIPFLGTVLLLPILVFKRSYSLFYLAQYGGDYDVFRPAPEFTP